MIAGGFDYLVKVRTSNVRDYRRVLWRTRSFPISFDLNSMPMESVLDQGAVNPDH